MISNNSASPNSRLAQRNEYRIGNFQTRMYGKHIPILSTRQKTKKLTQQRTGSVAIILRLNVEL